MVLRVEARHRVAIAGRVTAAGTGRPVPDALVEIASAPAAFQTWLATRSIQHGSAWDAMPERPDRTHTAPDGHFFFLDLPAGDYRLAVALPAAGSRVGGAGAAVTVAEGAAAAIAVTEVELPVTALAGRILSATGLYAQLVRSEPSLAARWRLDEASGAALDEVGGRHASPNGAITRGVEGLVAPHDDPAVRLDGKSGYFQAAYAPELNPPHVTVEAWVSPMGGSGFVRGVVSSRDNSSSAPHRGYSLIASDRNRWEFRVGDGSKWQAAVGSPVALDRVAHVVGTYDGTSARVYIDGALAGTVPAATMVRNGARPLRIGAAVSERAPAAFFAGAVDEVAIYGTALAPETVLAHFERGAHPDVSPVTMAAVQLEGTGEKTFTDAEGRFLLAQVESGERTVAVRAQGYRRLSRAVTLAPGAVRSVELALDPDSA